MEVNLKSIQVFLNNNYNVAKLLGKITVNNYLIRQQLLGDVILQSVGGLLGWKVNKDFSPSGLFT